MGIILIGFVISFTVILVPVLVVHCISFTSLNGFTWIAYWAFLKPRLTFFLGGKLLSDKMRISDCNIPPGHVIQCVVNDTPVQFDVIRTMGTIVGKE